MHWNISHIVPKVWINHFNTWLLDEMSLVNSYRLILKSNADTCHLSCVCTGSDMTTCNTNILYIVRCHYNTNSCHLNHHNRHAISRHWARAIKCCSALVIKVFFSISQHIEPCEDSRYAKLRVAHAPGMPGTFFPSPHQSRHVRHARAVMHAGIVN